MTVNPIYRSKRWTRVRAQVLARDNHTCQLQLTGCTVRANHVDHIKALADGGPPYALDNLRASCQSCNISAGNTARATRSGTYGEPWDRLIEQYGWDGFHDCSKLTPEDQRLVTGYDF